MGKRRTNAMRPSDPEVQSSGRISPPIRLASSAAIRNVRTARPISPRASRIGLPASSASRRARSSVSAANRAAMRSRICSRCQAASRLVSANAASAVAQARSASSADASGTCAISRPSYGLRITSTSVPVMPFPSAPLPESRALPQFARLSPPAVPEAGSRCRKFPPKGSAAPADDSSRERPWSPCWRVP